MKIFGKKTLIAAILTIYLLKSGNFTVIKQNICGKRDTHRI